MSQSPRPASTLRLAGLAALGLLSGSAWLLDSLWPRTAPLAQAEAMHFALIAIFLFGLRVVTHRQPWPSPYQILALATAGLCLFALPVLLLDRTSDSVPELSTVAIFAGIPAMTVVWAALLGDTSAIPRSLPPSLLGWCGALMLFPITQPASFHQTTAFAVVILAAISVAGAGLWLHRLLESHTLTAAATIIVATNAAAFTLAAALSGELTAAALHPAPFELLRGLALDLSIVSLTLWLLRSTDATQVATRTLLGPAVTILEGYLLLRERPPLLTILGAAMLLIASLGLVRTSAVQTSLTILPSDPD